MISHVFELTVTIDGEEGVAILTSGKALEPWRLAAPRLMDPRGDSGMVVACFA